LIRFDEPDTDTPMNFGNISQELTNIEEELSSPTKVYEELLLITFSPQKVVRGKASIKKSNLNLS